MASGARGLVIAAPRSGSGKTLVTLALARAMNRRGLAVAPAKAGPDFIDPHFLSAAAARPAINLDPWAMRPDRLRGLASDHARDSDILLVEGVMGLFDGAMDGSGSTADVAAALGLPVVLVIDCQSQAQSVAALALGFARFRDDVAVAGVILNRVGSQKHRTMIETALADHGVVCFGVLRSDPALSVPSRHLGLVLPGDLEAFDDVLDAAAQAVETAIDIDALLETAGPVSPQAVPTGLPPLGQHIAIARDAAFSFLYSHMLNDWRRAGATLSFFSPLADEAPAPVADAVFLPGGYPELHGDALANAATFRAGLAGLSGKGALIYGECGGFMVLGEALVAADCTGYEMTGLLPITTRIDRPRRRLGYRRLAHSSPLPWPARLNGHEFHYSSAGPAGLPALFDATDAAGETLDPMGAQSGRVVGSYAHVIDGASR